MTTTKGKTVTTMEIDVNTQTQQKALSVRAVARMLGVTPNTATALIDSGALRAFNASPTPDRRLMRVLPDDLQKFIAKRMTKPFQLIDGGAS